jgi:hypothetical protein
MLDKGEKAISRRTILNNQHFHAKCEYTPTENCLKKRWHEKDKKIMANAKKIFLHIIWIHQETFISYTFPEYDLSES